MQLKIQRSQRAGGMLGNTVLFCLDVRADYSPAESANIAKYKLGKELIYSSQAARRHIENMGRHLGRAQSENLVDKTSGLARSVMSLAMAKMNLNVSIASLGRGHHIECKDLPELLSAEETIMDACRNLKKYLAAAATFSGSVTLIDFDDEEKAHVSQGAMEFATLPVPAAEVTPAQLVAPATGWDFTSVAGFAQSLGQWIRTHYEAQPERMVTLGIAAAVVVAFLLYRVL